jgi:nucleotide-binding universal stress UspA family protein
MEEQSRRVVVGYDGSEAAGSAVDWAAAEASRRGAPLTVLYVAELLGLVPGHLPTRPNPFEAAAVDLTARGVERARKTAHGIKVNGETHVARAGAMLVEASKDAVLLVVGTRGHGEISGAVLGSVAFTVTAHAACPVVVVRGDAALPGPDRPVVVGVDDWPSAAPAVDFAAEVATAASAPLLVVSAYRPMLVELDVPEHLWRLESGGRSRFEELGREAALAATRAALLEVRERYLGMDVRSEVAEGPPARVLSDSAGGAALLVVGDRGSGGLAGLRLGSVSHALVHMAPCPFAVVRLGRPGNGSSAR